MPKKNEAVVVAPERLEAASDHVDWIGHAMADASFTATYRTRAAAACFAVVQEHHQAIVILTDHRIFASSFALVRVAFDSYVRGAWLSLCATEAQAEAFFGGKEPEGMNVLLKALEGKPEFSNGDLTAIKAGSWKAMCAYTHTGGLQVQRWNTDDAVEPNYALDEVMEVLLFSELLGMMSVVSFAGLIDDTALANDALARLKAMGR